MDEQDLAYAPPNEAGIVPSPKRRELFARPSALAGALALAHCLINVAMVSIKYASFGGALVWLGFVEDSALAALGIVLIRSDRRYLPQLALALITAYVVAKLLVGRVVHTGMPPAYAAMMFLAQATVMLLMLLPFALLLLGRPTPMRRGFALGIFALYALFMVGTAILTIQSSVFIKNRPAASQSLNDGNGAGRPQ